jgi:hypothetical protein
VAHLPFETVDGLGNIHQRKVHSQLESVTDLDSFQHFCFISALYTQKLTLLWPYKVIDTPFTIITSKQGWPKEKGEMKVIVKPAVRTEFTIHKRPMQFKFPSHCVSYLEVTDMDISLFLVQSI